jgi:hypothetical protein
VRDRAFVGVFDSPILQGQPIASTVVDTPGDFRFTGVPGGTWYVHTVALPCGGVPQDRSAAWQRPEPLVDCTGPLEVREQDPYAPERLEHLCLTPRPAEWFRPPVLLALPGGLPGGLPSGLPGGLPHTAVVCGLPSSGYREQSAAAV